MSISKQDFIHLANSNQGIIKSVCKAFYPDDEDQKDAFQDVILQLWKSYDTFRGESKITTWVYKVSLNTLLTKARSDKRKVFTEPISEHTNFTYLADDDLELLKAIIQTLKEVDKAVVILYLEGYKNKEIATMLSITTTNVSTRLNRVKAELKLKFKRAHHEFK
ncbi:sigma-70 family RNA polymerase sigma factor [Fulvivirga lutimaris]|uniref:sigma-70 family RNA polymerase sigma factor n=1 Tax=Fulvivirga lutimaris TaxID=1819566 RepID=UPI001629738E